MRKHKGFSIPELLAVIVIMGILVTIATASYNGISKSIKEKALANKIELIKTKALDYAEGNSINNETISVAKLIMEGYLEAERETDKNEKISNPLGGYLDCYNINIKRDLDDYEVLVNDSTNCNLADTDIASSKIKIYAYEIENGDTINYPDIGSNKDIKWTVKDVYLFLDPRTLPSVSDVKITWGTNSGVKTGNLTYSATNDERYVNIYKVSTVLVYNSSINVQIEAAGIQYKQNVHVRIDKEAPSLNVDMSAEYETGSKRIIFNGSDGSGSGIAEYGYALMENETDIPVFNITSKDNFKDVSINKTYYAYAKDNVGNISKGVEVNVTGIDNNKPVCKEPVDNPGWSRSYTYTYGCYNDIGTGCATLDVKETQNDEAEFKEVNWTIKDNIGNTRVCSKNVAVNVDTTPPTCEITVDPSSKKGNNNWYIGNVKLLLSTKDNLSGVSEYGITTNNTPEYNGSKTATLTNDTDRNGVTYYGYVKDKAGNTGSCKITVKKLTEIPTCTISKSGTYGKNGWFISNVNIAIRSNGRYISSEKINSSNGSMYGNSYILARDTSGENIEGEIENEAGLKGKCSTTVKRDATKPTASLRMQMTHCTYDVSYQTNQEKSDCDGGGYKTGTKQIACSTYENNGYSDSSRLNTYMQENVANFTKVLDTQQNIQYSPRMIELVCSDSTSGMASYSIGGRSGSTLDIYDASPQYYKLSGTCTDQAGNQTTVSTTFYRYEEEYDCSTSEDYFSKTNCENGSNTCAEKNGNCWAGGTEEGEKCEYRPCNEGSSKCDNPDNQTKTDKKTCGENKWRVA